MRDRRRNAFVVDRVDARAVDIRACRQSRRRAGKRHGRRRRLGRKGAGRRRRRARRRRDRGGRVPLGTAAAAGCATAVARTRIGSTAGTRRSGRSSRPVRRPSRRVSLRPRSSVALRSVAAWRGRSSSDRSPLSRVRNRSRISDGNSRLRTSVNICSRRGDASTESNRASGSFRIIDSAIDSASRVRPSAYREKARYSSTWRAISGAVEPPSRPLNVESASSYAADAYRSLAARS